MAEWHGLPPEFNTGRLIAGAGAEPYLQAQAGWATLMAEFTAALVALRTEISLMSSMWQGTASEAAQAAFEPYLAWMDEVIALATQRSAAAEAQAGTYTGAVAETPTLGEIAGNHITHAVLQSTNFMGVNTVPIAVNEFEYLVVLWNRASAAMDGYLAGTGVNTTFPPFPPAPSIMSAPGTPEAGLASVLASRAAALPASAARDVVLAGLQTSATAGAARGQVQEVGQFSGLAGEAAESIGEQGAQTQTTNATSDTSQMGGQAAQLLMQAPQMASQLPQQASQIPEQLMQTASQPMQELSSLFQGMGGNNLAGQGISPADLVSHFGSPDQFGAYGTSPVGSSGGGLGGAGLLSATNAGGSTPLRAPAGWNPPLAPAAPATEAAQRTAAVPSGGSSSMGSGSGMMGPMAAARKGEGSTAELDGPVPAERAVLTTLGFDVFDEDAVAG